MATPHNPTNYVLMIAEMRRYPQMSYKSDIVVLSGKSSSIITNLLRQNISARGVTLTK